MNSETRNCQNCKESFVIEPEDLGFYEKMQVPPPTWCPDCRLGRRIIFRNERVLFRRKDDASGKDILSGYPKDAPFPVYELDYWRSDNWDPTSYGRDFDPSRPFLEQFRELMHTVPHPSRSVMNEVNSDYSDQAGNIKNCYLCFNCDYLDDSVYTVRGNTSKDCCDVLQAQGSELIYDSVLIEKSAKVFYSLDCDGSTDMWFSKQCVGCTNCFGCVNLRKKSYCIWNEQYSKEEYFKKIAEMNLGSRSSVARLKREAAEFWRKFPSKFYHGMRNVNSTGDMLGDTKNAKNSWWVTDAQDVRYCQSLYLKTTDSYDYTVWGCNASRMYECLTCGEEVDNLKFCYDCWPSCRNLEYSTICRGSANLFGCVGLKKKEYCILNKQYSKEEYEALREKIVKHMNEMPYVDKQGREYKYGEFFPPEFSVFGYNETMMFDSFPLTKEEALAKGYKWRDPDQREFETTIKGKDLPDNIKDATDAVTKEIAECSSCAKAYRVVPQELQFHTRLNLPLPDACPNCRQSERFRLLNPPKFTERACGCAGKKDSSGAYQNSASHDHGEEKCPNKFETAYGDDTIVYCESCYLSEVT